MDVIEVGQSRQLFFSFPEHRHGYWEILLNTQGHGTMYLDSRAYDFAPGDIFIIPPFTPHRKESEEGFLDLSLFIRDFRPIGKEGMKHFTDDENQSVRKAMELALYLSSIELSCERSAVNAVGDLVYQILVCYYRRSSRRDLRLERLVDTMHQHLTDPTFDLSAAIDETGYCKGYFRKIFKQSYEESPVSYFNRLRISHAKKLFLQYGDSRTVKDIALASGFSDPLYFSRIFSRYEGMSPTAYVAHIHSPNIELVIMDTPEELL